MCVRIGNLANNLPVAPRRRRFVGRSWSPLRRPPFPPMTCNLAMFANCGAAASAATTAPNSRLRSFRRRYGSGREGGREGGRAEVEVEVGKCHCRDGGQLGAAASLPECLLACGFHLRLFCQDLSLSLSLSLSSREFRVSVVRVGRSVGLFIHMLLEAVNLLPISG